MGKLRACALQSIPGLFSTPTQMKRPGYEARYYSELDTLPLSLLYTLAYSKGTIHTIHTKYIARSLDNTN